MRIRSSYALVATILTLAVMGLAPAASAEGSLADRFIAAGGGDSFTAAVGASGYAATTCLTDPTDDVVDLDNDGVAIDEERGDITDFCATYGSTTTTLSLEVVSPTDPATDINWNGSLIGWFIDVQADGNGDYFAGGFLDDEGALAGNVEDRNVSGSAEVVCDADFTYSGGVFTLEFDNDCIGDPDSISVSPGYIYDQRVEDTEGVATFDEAPNDDAFPAPVEGTIGGVTRYAGGERIGTAVAISQAQFGDGEADTVVLARQDLFPDAMTGTPLAIALNAPILLTQTDVLSGLTEAEIGRVTGGEGTVVILGGTAAVSEAVETALTDAGYTVVRYGGSNRFQTAVAVAQALGSPTTVLAADGGTYQDALVAGTAAPTVDAAVLLTDGGTVPPATEAYLAAGEVDVTAIGASAATALPEVESVGTDDPIETAVAVAEAYYPDSTVVGIARVDEFPDALAGGAYVGNPAVGPGPILFVETEALPGAVSDYLIDNAVDSAAIFGGVAAISAEVQDAIDEIV